jgi:hypothetical protein
MKILQKLPFILLAATVVLAFTQADEVGVASTKADDPRKFYTEEEVVQIFSTKTSKS